MRIQNTVIVSVYGGVVQDIATDLDPDRVRFVIVVDAKVPVEGQFGGTNPSKLSDIFAPDRLRRLGVDACQSDADASKFHAHGLRDCRSPQLWRRQVVDDLDEG